MPIKVLYLTHFNVHKGYELVWWKYIESSTISKDQIEYKSLPSGIHSIHKDVICFKHEGLFGLTVFRQNSLSLLDMDRSKVKMYSLGILSDDPLDKIWNFKDQLDINLSQLMVSDFHDDDLDIKLLPLFDRLTSSQGIGMANTSSASLTVDLIDELKPMFETIGPLLFTIWKLALLKKRIIFSMEGNECDHELLNKYIFCLDSISKLANDSSPSEPIYNVCINDIPQLEEKDKFIACTSDQIILEKPQLFDYSIKIPYSDSSLPEIRDNNRNVIYSTGRDLMHFKLVYEQLFGHIANLEYDKLSSYKSFGEIIWFVMSWWATAGDSLNFDRDIDVPLESNEDLNGYFKRLNTKMFNDLKELTDTDEPIPPHELYEIGFDPSNSGDVDFVVSFSKQRFQRDVSIGNYMNCLC